MKLFEYNNDNKVRIKEINNSLSGIYFKYITCYPKENDESKSYLLCTNLKSSIYIKNNGLIFYSLYDIPVQDRVRICISTKNFDKNIEEKVSNLKIHTFLTFLNNDCDKNAKLIYNAMISNFFILKTPDYDVLEKLNKQRMVLLKNPDDFSLKIDQLIRSRK